MKGGNNNLRLYLFRRLNGHEIAVDLLSLSRHFRCFHSFEFFAGQPKLEVLVAEFSLQESPI